MKEDNESIQRATLPEGAVRYKPEEELYQKLRLCVYMRELLDDPPFDPAQPEPDPHRKK
jgi:hypothetical protein